MLDTVFFSLALDDVLSSYIIYIRKNVNYEQGFLSFTLTLLGS